ncbi:dirigent protein [Blastococcus sp. CT_GayMR19]|uniref:dirigent protein n=1 Tax=Blastococcus sp. CT_GayMR19 TaxID=2559608 RepID=UPI00143000FC|nr:dirigent protein [Blastococcus sp. CT_GayMR19]
MRRIAVLSALVLTGGLVGPSSALAAEDNENRWIAVEDHFAIVLPDGTTFTEDEEGMPEEELPPVGSRLFISEVLHETEDGETAGSEVGRSHIECTAQAAELIFSCDATFAFDSGSQLHGTVVVDFGAEEPTEAFQLDIAVTGGSGDFFGATGVVNLLDITDVDDPDAATTTLYEADIHLAE